MSKMTSIVINGDPFYTNLVAIDFLNKLGWSRKRKCKWLRRNGLYVDRNRIKRFVLGDDDYDDGESSESGYCFHCNNTGWVNCYCGGDLCVCYNFGEYPCPHCG